MMAEHACSGGLCVLLAPLLLGGIGDRRTCRARHRCLRNLGGGHLVQTLVLLLIEPALDLGQTLHEKSVLATRTASEAQTPP